MTILMVLSTAVVSVLECDERVAVATVRWSTSVGVSVGVATDSRGKKQLLN